MKEMYIAPESRLYAINISENIAGSSAEEGGGDAVQGNAVIKFSQVVSGCRAYYTDDTTSPVTANGEFGDYFNELNNLGKPMTYWNCFKWKF